MPLRRLDPTCRLRGYRALGALVERACAELRRAGVEPVVAASGWALPGEVGFYCGGHPVVYSLGPVFGDRCSQYEFWRPNPIADPERFRGRTFVFVSPGPPGVEQGFERLDPPHVLDYAEGGHFIARWHVTVCRGFKGFVNLPPAEGRYF
jgi:hypothetical protein